MVRLLLLLLAAVVPSAALGQAGGRAPDRPPRLALLRRALTDPVLWGRDRDRALASLGAWAGAGERLVTLHPDAVVGGTPQADARTAEAHAARLSAALLGVAPAPGPRSGPLQRAALAVRAMPIVEDDSTRLVLTGADLRVLPPDLSIAAIRQRLGPPERMSRRMIQNHTDNRPVVLKLYEYAGGALVYAESNYASRPGTVDRVYIDVASALAALAEQPRRAPDHGGRR